MAALFRARLPTDQADSALPTKSAPADKGSLPSGESDPVVTLDCAGASAASEIVPCAHGYQYFDGVRFNDGREVNGMRPTSSFPIYNQEAVDTLLGQIESLRAEVERLFAGADTVSPEELEQLIADKSANRAADEIISKYDVRRRG